MRGLLNEKASSIAEGLKKIQFKAAASLYTQLRENVLQSAFPIDLFENPRALPRIVKNAEQEAHAVSMTAERIAWTWENSSGLVRPIDEGKIIWATIEIEELKHYLTQVDPLKIQLTNRNLTDVLFHGYRPRAPAELLFEQWSDSLLPVIFIAALALIPVAFIPASWLPLKKRSIALMLLLLSFSICIASYSAWRILGPTLFGPSAAVRQSREVLLALRAYEVAFSEGHHQVSTSLQHFEDYCAARMGINETLTAMMSDFNKRIEDALTESHGAMVTRPEVVLDIVQVTQKELRTHKLALVKLSASREKHSPSSRVKLDHVIELVDSVQGLFSSLEVKIYENLLAGYHTTDVIINHLINIQGYVDEHKLQDCAQFMAALQNYQSRQLVDLKSSNNYIAVINDKVSELRLENTRLQPHFSTEEFMSTVKKWGARAGIITSSAPLLGALALPVTLAVPAVVVGVGVAAIGYNWQALYENAEGDAKQIVAQLRGLDEVLKQIESGLSSHEVTLSNLVTAVSATVTSISFSQKRFKAVMIGKVYTDDETKQLKDGIGRVMESMEALRKQYRDAEQTLYNKLRSEKQEKTALLEIE